MKKRFILCLFLILLIFLCFILIRENIKQKITDIDIYDKNYKFIK